MTIFWKRVRRMLHLWRHLFDLGKNHRAIDVTYWWNVSVVKTEVTCTCGKEF